MNPTTKATSTRLQAAARACEFLIGVRSPDGGWRDFETLAGISDVWVTAYTGCALFAGGWAEEARAALRFVKARSPGGPWSYNAKVPPDADSTVWVCRLAEALGEWPQSHQGALEFLAGCVRADGGLATYASADRVRKSMRIHPAAPFDGWLSSHRCVTAAAAALPHTTFQSGAIQFLRRTQDPAGMWKPYWWMDGEYSTALAVEALLGTGCGPQDPAIRKALVWASGQGCCGSPFAIACRLRILQGRGGAAAEELTEALVRAQGSDGSWVSSARMRIPPPSVIEPQANFGWDPMGKGTGSVRLDQNRVFTTATALAALASAGC